jgi:sugar lactone lactonase YvrE
MTRCLARPASFVTLPLAALLALLPITAAAYDRAAIRSAYEAAKAAHDKKDWPAMLAESRTLVSLAPRSTRAAYALACAQSLNGQKAEALASLARLADSGVRFDLTADADLAGLRDLPEFAEVVARMKALDTRIGASTPAFTLPEKDLLTEGVVHDPKTGAFFVSSVHRRKILRVARDGQVSDFVAEGAGLFSVTALAVDPTRRSLYVSTKAQPLMMGFRKEEDGQWAVVEYDLETAKPRRRLVTPNSEGAASDLALGPDGQLFGADPDGGRIYVAKPDATAFAVLVDGGPIVSAQGMAVSKDGRFLFVADYAQGIARVDLKSRAVVLLPTPDTLVTTGIDGLVVAGDSLVGIQNGIEPHRVLRLRLDAAAEAIVEGTILERASPYFDEPTLGTLVGSDFYYIANSQYGAFDENGKPDEARLKAPAVLKLRLPWLEGH